jgi:signal transduction histidine kinase
MDVSVNIAELSDLFRDVVGGAVRLVITIDRDLMRCHLDPILFKSVLCNLVINARNAMPRGGEICIAGSNVQLDATAAAAKGLAAGAYVMISVSDTGIGITPQLQARIFDPFVTTQQARGSGLGLSILHGFVKTSGGHVELASEPGNGATFTLYFPAIAAQRNLADCVQNPSNTAAYSIAFQPRSKAATRPHQSGGSENSDSSIDGCPPSAPMAQI